ncbi:ESX secretion-associated protein EspG [Segniliparus rotundus]|nr:ESX secretion-associated protein EspG [Segniliparus rotundus]
MEPRSTSRSATPDSFDAVELTLHQAWLVAELVGAGEYPSSLFITAPFAPGHVAEPVISHVRQELVELGVIGPDGKVDKRVASWVSAVCAAQQFFEARTVRGDKNVMDVGSNQLHAFIAHNDSQTVVAMRAGGLVTFTQLGSPHPKTLASVLTAGLPGAKPAKFRQFALPTAAGAKADERLRRGAAPEAVLAELGLSEEARTTLKAMLDGRRSFVEISFGARLRKTDRVGIGVLDTALGRVLVAPSRAPDGQWLSTFSPGTTPAIAAAVQQLAETQLAQAERNEEKQCGGKFSSTTDSQWKEAR